MGRIAILGHFGGNQSFLDGQTVKTKTLRDGLKKYSDFEVVEVDTYGWKKEPLSLYRKISLVLKECDATIMLPAHNGVKIFAPLLLHLNKKYKKKIFYDVIGGWLPEFLCNRKRLTEILKLFNGIWVETHTMRNALVRQGFTNVSVIPNFKELNILKESELVYPEDTPYRLCTFSRVMKEKGIETAIEVIKKVNVQLGYTAYSLDIYGQVDSGQVEWFNELQNQFPDYIQYKGSVDADKSVDVLKEFFALLFPTYYEGEGFAGTLIDAYSAGVPVIATDWRYNAELISEKTGFIFPTGDQVEFERILKEIAINPTLILNKKQYCIQEADKYSIDKAVQIMIVEMESEK